MPTRIWRPGRAANAAAAGGFAAVIAIELLVALLAFPKGGLTG
jgi:hypothetical protein